MRRRLSLIVTLTAWLFATGSHWDLVQTFAWGKMFASYAQSMSYLDAARLTFTPDNLCNVCAFVQDARQSTDENGHPAPAESGTQKILLALDHAPRVVVAAPAPETWLLSDRALPPPLATAPPAPPPRA